MSDTIQSARTLIEGRLGELAKETTQLERALAALREAGGTRRHKAESPARRPTIERPLPSRPRARRSRAPRGLRREQLFAALKGKPGARPSELAKAMGVKPAQVHALISMARSEKLIVKRDKGYALKS